MANVRHLRVRGDAALPISELQWRVCDAKWAVTVSGSYSDACGARYGVMEYQAASWEMSGYDC